MHHALSLLYTYIAYETRGSIHSEPVRKSSTQPGKPHLGVLILLLRYHIQYHSHLGRKFCSNERKCILNILLKEHNVEPQRKLFTFFDSTWQNDWDNGRCTGGYQFYYMGGVFDHLSNIPDQVALSSAESKYTELYLACQAWAHLHMTLNKLENVETGGKEDKPIDIVLHNK
jgi:hypothetical protein